MIRQGIKHFINWEQEGFRIVGEAANGREALEMIRDAHPDIVLTDIVMPLMDGEELTREIKNVNPDIEVVVLSSFSEFDYVRSSFQSGVADYILKPTLEVDGLLKVLRKTVEKAQSSRKRAQHASAVSVPRPIDQMLEGLLAGYAEYADAEAALVREHFPHDRFMLLGADVKRLPAEAREPGGGLSRILADVFTGGLSDVRCHDLVLEQKVAVLALNVPSIRLAEAERAIRRSVVSAAECEPELTVVSSGPVPIAGGAQRRVRGANSQTAAVQLLFIGQTAAHPERSSGSGGAGGPFSLASVYRSVRTVSVRSRL